MEEWRDIESLEGQYMASNLGNIYSKRSKKNLVFSQDSFGYCRINFRKFGLKMVHKLILASFMEQPINKNEVNHKDGDPQNNKLENLEWVSSRENASHRSEKNKNKTSKFTGVSLDKKRGLWKSTIYINGKQKFLGRFVSEELASKAYKEELVKLNEENKYVV